MKLLTVRWLCLVLLVAAVAFVAGFQVHRAGLHRELIFLLNRVVKVAWPASIPVPPYARFEQCGCVEYLHACPCGKRGEKQIYEVSLWKQFLELDPGFTYRLNPDFPALAREAVGFDNILPRHEEGGVEIAPVAKSPFGKDGTISDLRLRYTHPKLALRALLATHDEAAKELVIVLHGISSSEDAVMGLSEEDYLKSVGRTLFEKGYDVLAPSVTSNSIAAGAMNLSLQLLGGQIYGLWSRSVCDAAQHLRQENGYDRIVLYGLSNGGIITKHATALCHEFQLSIVDDVGLNEREGTWNSTARVENLKWSFLSNYRRPLLAESSVVDWLYFANNTFVFIGRKEAIRKKLPRMTHEVFDHAPGFRADSRIHFVEKRTGLHAPEVDLITAILEGDWSRLEGHSLTPRGRE